MSLEKFIGQPRIKAQIRLIIEEGKQDKLPHLGIFGRAGMGKTTLSHIIADELCAKLIYMNGTAVKNPVAFLTEVYKAKADPTTQHIVFIDEAHNLPSAIQENMLSMLEDPAILCLTVTSVLKKHLPEKPDKPIVVGQTARIYIPPNVAFILATTHKGHLTETILSRMCTIDLDSYSEDESIEILRQAANMDLPETTLRRIAKIGKSIRGMKKHLKSFEVYINMRGLDPDKIKEEHFRDYCEVKGIGQDGCDSSDILYMKTLFKHRRVGLNSMISMLCLSKEEVINIIEPWLLKKDYIRMTPQGRELTAMGLERIGESITEARENLFDIED